MNYLMYFPVNASPPKPLDVATSNFADAQARSHNGPRGWGGGYSDIFIHT